MARKLGKNLKNRLTINDPVSQSKIVFFYRIPTSEERVAYYSSMFERDPEKVRQKVPEARQQWGLKIMEGFEDGAFEKPQGDEWVQFSSRPDSGVYDPAWKELVKLFAPDLVEALAAHVFEGATISASQGETFTEKN